MQEYCFIPAQALQRGRHDVARARKARWRISDAAPALPAFGFQPRVEQAEVFAAMVGLAVLVALRLSTLQHGGVLGLAIAHTRDVLGDMNRCVGIVSDPEQQYLPIELVHTAGRAVQAVGHVYWMRQRDSLGVRTDRGEGMGTVASQDARHPPEGIREYA